MQKKITKLADRSPILFLTRT